MAEITKAGTPSPCSANPATENFFGENLAGENVAAGDQLYLKSDGLVWLASGAAATAPGVVIGQAARAASVGEPVTRCTGQRFWYGSGLTPGAQVYLSATVPGGLSTVATTGGVSPLGYVMQDGARIQFYYPRGII